MNATKNKNAFLRNFVSKYSLVREKLSETRKIRDTINEATNASRCGVGFFEDGILISANSDNI